MEKTYFALITRTYRKEWYYVLGMGMAVNNFRMLPYENEWISFRKDLLGDSIQGWNGISSNGFHNNPLEGDINQRIRGLQKPVQLAWLICRTPEGEATAHTRRRKAPTGAPLLWGRVSGENSWCGWW